MAPKFTGHDDYKREEAELRDLAAARQELASREVARRREVQRTAGVVDEASAAEASLSGARREAREVKRREKAVLDTETSGLKANTREIEMNTSARQKATRAAVDFNQAVKGARDPQFPAAHAMAEGGTVSQKAIRRELDSVGSRRAAAMQAAVHAGMVPSAGGVPVGARTRHEQALVNTEMAEREYTQATRRVTNLRNRKTVVDESEMASAVNDREAKRQARDVARQATAAAGEEAQASREKAAAARAEVERARRAAEPGTDIVRRTPETGAVGGRMFGQRIPGPFGPLGQVIRTGTGEPYLGQGVRAEVGGREGARNDPRAAAAQAATQAAAQAAAQQKAAQSAAQQAAAQQAAASAAAAAKAQMDRYDAALTQADESARRMTARQGAVRSATRDAATEFGTLSQQMTRHGALTSEFIIAAARGETTLKELGNQAVITAGKFGGWTAAASALFGAATAVQRVGKGAIDASSGVQSLQRVITTGFDAGTAQTEFARLAQEFNVPISVVTDAIYRMGQRFHDLPNALLAARAALYSFKTGEVDVGTSTEYLLAIVNGFGLGAGQLTTVFDQINQAQNVFGVKIGETEQGIARAGGTWKNAGGDFNTLLALFTSISRATGESGSTIGTGLLRSVNQIRQVSNQAKLEAQGVTVDPTNIQKTFASAFKAARAPGADINQIATGLLGTQYFRLLAPVLKNQKTFNDALRDTSPEKAKGSAQRELAKVLDQASERIKAVGIDLETLGAHLAEAGAFTIAGGFLKGLDMALDLLNKIVHVFNTLVPPDLRPFVTSLMQIGVAYAAIRRFGGFEKLAAQHPALMPMVNQDRRLQIRAERGMRDQLQEARNYQESQQRTLLRNRIDVEAAHVRSSEFETSYQQRKAGGLLPAAGTDEATAIEEHRTRLHQDFLRAEERTNATGHQINSAKKVAITTERELADLQKLHHREVRAYLASRGINVAKELGSPNLAGIVPVTPPAPGATTPGVTPGIFAATSGPLPTGHPTPHQYPHPIGPQIPRLNAKELRDQQILGARMSLATALGRDAQDLRALGYSYNAIERAAYAGNAAVGKLESHALRARESMKGMGSKMATSMESIIGGLGFFDVALLTYMAGDMLINKYLENQKKHVDEMNAKADAPQSTTAGMRKALDVANKKLSEGKLNDESQQAYTDALRLQTELRAQNVNPITSGRRNSLLATDTITAQAQEVSARFKDGQASLFMLDSAINTAIEDVTHSAIIPKAQKGPILSQLANMSKSAAARKSALAAMDDEQLKQAQAAQVALAQMFGGSSETMGRITQIYQVQASRLAGKTDDASIVAMGELRQKYWADIDQITQGDVTFGLSIANSEAERRKVYARSASALKNATVRPAQQNLGRLQDAVTDARARAAHADTALSAAEQASQVPGRRAGTLGGGVIAGIPTVDLAAARKAAAEAKKELDRLRKERDAADEELKAQSRVYRQKRREIQRLSYPDRQTDRQLTLSVEQARTPDRQDQAANSLRTAEADLKDARRFGTRSREYRTALAAVFTARNDVAQALLGHIQAENAMLMAQAGDDPVSQANAALTSEQNTLTAMQANPKRVSRDDLKTQQATVIQRTRARDKAVLDEELEHQRLIGELAVTRAGDDPFAAAKAAQANARRALGAARTRNERTQALVDLAKANNDYEQAIKDQEAARAEYLATLTTDPVQQARIRERTATRNVKGTHGAARYRALAERNTARRTRLDAELASKEDDIEFEKDMGRLSVQGAIDRYQELLKIKTLTKAQRRDIQRKIKSLQDQSESEASGFDLDVGSIKLPTVYDVRKAWDPIRDKVRNQRRDARNVGLDRSEFDMSSGGRVPVGDMSSNATTNATIIVNVTDKNSASEVYTQIDRALKTNVRAKARSARRR